MKDKWIDRNWTEYFRSHQWEADGGPAQSLVWYLEAISRLYNFVPESIHDYGCATGDGTVLLQTFFPRATVTGYDAEIGAILRARERWQGTPVVFQLGNVERPRPWGADLITAFQVVEQTEHPTETLLGLLRTKPKVLMVAWSQAIRSRMANVLTIPSFVEYELFKYNYDQQRPGADFVDRVELLIWVRKEVPDTASSEIQAGSSTPT